jgi:hypothetical protein
MNRNLPYYAVSLAAGAMLGAIVAAALDEPPMSSPITSAAAEAAPIEEQHGHHAPHPDHTHEEEEYGGSPVAVPLTGQAISVEQGAIRRRSSRRRSRTFSRYNAR